MATVDPCGLEFFQRGVRLFGEHIVGVNPDQVDRIQDFSRIQARASHAEGRRVRILDMILRPPARFLRAYLLKQGFRDGVPGLVIAAATAFHVFLKYAKQWELDRVRPREDTARDAGKARRAS
jgi:hypothetical protein